MPGFRYVSSSIASGLLLSLSVLAGSDSAFHVEAPSAYAHQAVDQVTIGAKAYKTDEQTEDAFGKKNNLLKYRVLPVLVVVENKRNKTVDLSRLEVNLVAADGRHAPAVSPEEIQSLGTPKGGGVSQVPKPIPFPKKKNALRSPAIESRAFAARMLPPGETASGFFYFEAAPEDGDQLYINGLRESGSGREIMYFEFPLSGS
jgi:hypothetical protein